MEGLGDTRTSLCIHVGVVQFHETAGDRQRSKAGLGIQVMSVARGEHEPAKALELRVPLYRLDHLLRETSPAVGLENVDVGEVCERGLVGDDPREADLLAAGESSETDGIVEGPLHD